MKRILFLILILIIIALGLFLFSRPKEIKISNNWEEKPTVSPEISVFDPELFDWKKVDADIPWSKRDAHASVAFKGRIWVLGGLEGVDDFDGDYSKLDHKNDVWASANGKDWIQVIETAPWGKRRSLAAVVFKDKMWIMGGWQRENILSRELKNDVWYSEDGISWIEATDSAAWTPREGHSVVVFKDKIWILGGVDFNKRELKNDVWYSEDGISWIEATSNAAWSPRYDHAVSVFQGKMWLTGGVAFGQDATNDVWVSEDGQNWELVAQNAPWPVRHGHTSLVFKDKIWVISGWDTKQGHGLKDSWYSDDGLDWSKTLKDSPWIGREDHTSVVFKDKIWIMGGMNSDWKWENDVWYSTL